MWEDNIVKETRALREQYASEFSHDLDAIFNNICLRQKESGRNKVSFPGRKVMNPKPVLQASEDEAIYTSE